MSHASRFEKDGIRRLVLIVDDEHVNRRLLGRIIEEKYDVIYAEDGKEAYELIMKREKTLSMVLLDLIMPEMDGYQLLEKLHDDPNLSRIPVIVLTSEHSAEVRSLQLGAADFITKPYDLPEVILARVTRSIELAEDKSIISATENDPLTGLYNREYFFQHARRYDQYYPDAEMDALVININRLHLINELHGRLFGDDVISCIAQQINSLLTRVDGFACRCDADTFYLYISRLDDYEGVLNHIAGEIAVIAGNTRVSLRMGVYMITDKSVDVETRFDRATFACNTLRNNYSTSLTFYDDRMHEDELYSEKLIGDMDIGVAEHQFKVYYQPKYNITGSEPVLTSAEALIRWEHPEYGMVNPGNFIPLFEENGLVQKLDHYVWKEAAAQIKRWRDKYDISMPVSVNVSRLDLYDPQLESMLLGLVKDNGLEPYEYLLEITESAYTDNSEQIVETVKKLRDHGFRVEMDDFGAGYSSLNMLAALPIDALKLDMVFIRKITENEKDAKMVQLMIDIARFLHIPVIAEGVETKEQYDLLKKIGCDIIQGYYFSKPVPPEEFEKFIEEAIKHNAEEG
ncbi:MAG: EAL domain-containing protein [Ruminiclostridium sp.]|nr:EAL domain-containing protein [Ruminiclostridium sp.]